MEKPRYTTQRKGGWYWEPTKAMRATGLVAQALGKDRAEAFRKAEELNATWDEMRRAEERIDEGIFTVGRLLKSFEKDPAYYGALAPRTKQEVDYAFKVVHEIFGDVPVKSLRRKHCRAFYNQLRLETTDRMRERGQESGSAHRAKKVMKWFSRALTYAVDEWEAIDTNPATRLKMVQLHGRNQVWQRQEVAAVIAAAMAGGKSSQGNAIQIRLSVALATQLAYNTAQRLQDILSITWAAFDGEGLEVRQRKTGQKVWVPLSDKSLEMLAATDRVAPQIIISEATGQPYTTSAFGRLFAKVKRRAGVTRNLTFHDLRRTAATELGESGATEAEIVSITGHKLGSRVIDTYVRPGRGAARNAARKRKKSEVGTVSELGTQNARNYLK